MLLPGAYIKVFQRKTEENGKEKVGLFAWFAKN